MNFMKKSVIVASTLAMLISGAAHATGIDVTAGYDGNYDDSYFMLTNTSASSFTNIVFTSNGDGGSDSLHFSDLGAGASATNYFNGSAGFTNDYDDSYGGNNQTYTLTGLLNGKSVTTTFSPTSNSSGGFVAFLGNDISGNEYDADVATQVASISAVPEPETYAMLLAGLGLMGFMTRRKSGKKTA